MNAMQETAMNPDAIFYGPHPCDLCGGGPIVRGSTEQGFGDIRLDYPNEPIYPNHKWKKHECGNNRLEKVVERAIAAERERSGRLLETEARPQYEICPSCQGADNRPFVDGNGNEMRACGRCVIQWRVCIDTPDGLDARDIAYAFLKKHGFITDQTRLFGVADLVTAVAAAINRYRVPAMIPTYRCSTCCYQTMSERDYAEHRKQHLYAEYKA